MTVDTLQSSYASYDDQLCVWDLKTNKQINYDACWQMLETLSLYCYNCWHMLQTVFVR